MIVALVMIENVVSLQITVDHILGMQVMDGGCQLLEHVGHIMLVHAFFSAGGQVPPRTQLGHDVEKVQIFIETLESNDGGMM